VKRAITIFGCLLGSVALFAQVHGPAASVTSSTGRSMVTGPAASVLSTGPQGWQTGPCMTPQCVNPAFTPTINFQTGTVHLGQQPITGRGRGGHHRGNNGGGGGYVYTYPYPVYVPVEPEQVEDQEAEQQSEPPAPTVFERRSQVRLAPNPTPVGNDESRYGQHYLDQREQRDPVAEPNATGGHHTMSPVSDEQIPVLIVYKDGHEQEIHNYAIVGDTIYDIGTSIAHKIKLADVDLKQTIQKNEQRGVDFTVPVTRPRKPAA
jgi:hypothetical protein